jgi:hypothetical protein
MKINGEKIFIGSLCTCIIVLFVICLAGMYLSEVHPLLLKAIK